MSTTDSGGDEIESTNVKVLGSRVTVIMTAEGLRFEKRKQKNGKE